MKDPPGFAKGIGNEKRHQGLLGGRWKRCLDVILGGQALDFGWIDALETFDHAYLRRPCG
ncbi:hypothetical protein D3C87_1988180 [compost metagenome]